MFIPWADRGPMTSSIDAGNSSGGSGGSSGTAKVGSIEELDTLARSFLRSAGGGVKLELVNNGDSTWTTTTWYRVNYEPTGGITQYVYDDYFKMWVVQPADIKVHLRKVTKTYYAGGNGGGGFQFNYTSHGLNFADGLFTGFETLTYSDKGWLGKNGKIYNSLSGRGPNQHTGSRGAAKAASSNYRKAGNGVILIQILIGGYQTIKGYEKDGNSFGYNAQHALATNGLGIIGGYVGAKIGVSVGGLSTAWAGGVPGAAIGGVLGSIGGSYGGSWLGGYIVDSIHNP
jgi:hypothetical protein